MAKNFSLVVIGGTDENPVVPGASLLTLTNIQNYLNGAIGGANTKPVTVHTRGNAVKAAGTITITSGAGVLTATINGVAVTATWATSDANSAGLLAAAINASANALVKNHVTATAANNVVTISAFTPGIAGNAITLAGSGTGVAANGARLVGGTETLASFSF